MSTKPKSSDRSTVCTKVCEVGDKQLVKQDVESHCLNPVIHLENVLRCLALPGSSIHHELKCCKYWNKGCFSSSTYWSRWRCWIHKDEIAGM